MNFWKIKWENIFTIIVASILIAMTIKFVIINGFNFDTIMFDLVYMTLSLIGIRWCTKMSRKFFLNN